MQCDVVNSRNGSVVEAKKAGDSENGDVASCYEYENVEADSGKKR